MKEFLKTKKVTYNLMSFTGFKSMLLLSYLLEAPHSYEEIKKYFMENEFIHESISIDTLRVYINSLERLGCEIVRGKKAEGSKYKLVKHPFELRITDEQDEQNDGDRYMAVETPLAHMINENEWLTESIDEGLILVDERDEVIFRNMYAKKLFQNLGYVRDILGQKYKNVCLTEWEEHLNRMEQLREVRYGKFYLQIRQIPLRKGNLRLAVIIRDITWNREQEKDLILKSVAVRELNHRVKNNLQIVASLLRLQARRVDNEETKKVLNETISRILSISVTHQLLSQTGEDRVSLMEVLRTVKNNAIQPFLKPELKLNLELQGDDIIVDTDIASSVALTVNELLQNSMRHAFDGRREGTIFIIVERGNAYSKLTVRDDGMGFDTENTRAGSLGLDIVRSVVQDKLHGKLRIRSGESGTSVSFDFINETADFVSVSE